MYTLFGRCSQSVICFFGALFVFTYAVLAGNKICNAQTCGWPKVGRRAAFILPRGGVTTKIFAQPNTTIKVEREIA